MFIPITNTETIIKLKNENILVFLIEDNLQNYIISKAELVTEGAPFVQDKNKSENYSFSLRGRKTLFSFKGEDGS